MQDQKPLVMAGVTIVGLAVLYEAFFANRGDGDTDTNTDPDDWPVEKRIRWDQLLLSESDVAKVSVLRDSDTSSDYIVTTEGGSKFYVTKQEADVVKTARAKAQAAGH